MELLQCCADCTAHGQKMFSALEAKFACQAAACFVQGLNGVALVQAYICGAWHVTKPASGLDVDFRYTVHVSLTRSTAAAVLEVCQTVLVCTGMHACSASQNRRTQRVSNQPHANKCRLVNKHRFAFYCNDTVCWCLFSKQTLSVPAYIVLYHIFLAASVLRTATETLTVRPPLHSNACCCLRLA